MSRLYGFLNGGVFQKLVHEVQDNLESIPSVRALAVRTGVSERLCDMLF